MGYLAYHNASEAPVSALGKVNLVPLCLLLIPLSLSTRKELNMHYTLILRINEYPPTFNGKGGLLRMHWSTRRKHLEHWQELIWYSLSAEERTLFQTKQFTSCTITFTRYTTHHMGLDWSNCASSLKIPEDAFVQLGILQDDSPLVVQGVEVRQVVGVQTKGSDVPFTGVEFQIAGRLSSYDRDQFMTNLSNTKAGKTKNGMGEDLGK
jgi:hypothetical protein